MVPEILGIKGELWNSYLQNSYLQKPYLRDFAPFLTRRFSRILSIHFEIDYANDHYRI